jgi:hypothetical protein
MPRYNNIFLGASRNNEMHMSFDDAINLSPGQGRSIDPQIAALEKNRTVFVVWRLSIGLAIYTGKLEDSF